MNNTTTTQACSLVRRLAAILYDCLLLSAVLFVATFTLMPITGGEAIESGNIPYNIFLLTVSYFYFCWHWVSGGQTLGMRSWHIFVTNASSENPNWKQASLRFFSAMLSIVLCGLGFIWSLFDKNKLALHDRLSKTSLVVNKEKFKNQ